MPPSRKAVTGSLPPSATPSCPCVRKITINLAPADIRKEGSAFDLPIALGTLSASGLIENDRLKKLVILGQLSLDGRVKPIRGGLSITAMARENGMEGVLLPAQNAAEVSVIEGIPIHPIETLPQALEFLCGKLELQPVSPETQTENSNPNRYELDFTDVKGQHHVKRALEIAPPRADTISCLSAHPVPVSPCWQNASRPSSLP